VSISRHYPFDNVVDLPDAPAAVFFGSIIGEDARLNMQGSSISGSYGAGAIAWNGGEANIVSSVLEDAGGISISDGETKQGELNFVNSILYMTGGDSLSQTNRIQAAAGGEANVIASSVLLDHVNVDESCNGISYECAGMPLTATLDGILNFNSSVVVPLNAEFFFPGRASYSEFSGGDLRADDFSFILQTMTQDEAAVRALFGNSIIQTTGDTFELQDTGEGFSLFQPLPGGATPIFEGALWRYVSDAGSGGANVLINPITGEPILFDVYGNDRVSSAGFRDIGAVQALAPVPLPAGLPLLLTGLFVLAGLRRR